MLFADATIIGVTLAFGGGVVVEGGQVQRRGVKEGGRRDELAPANDGSEVYQPQMVHDRCHCRPHSSIRTLVVFAEVCGGVEMGL
jgi:hypothetical protein